MIDREGVRSADDGVSLPCAHCGRPVSQRQAAGRAFRYCRDNDGACQRASRTARAHQRGAPGLAGQVARAYEVMERLEQVVDLLGDALHTELSPVGVERQVAAVRAEAAALVVTAHTERDQARRESIETRAEAEKATREVADARAWADAVRAQTAAEVDTIRSDLAQAREAARLATASAAETLAREHAALAERDTARRDAATAEALRIDVQRERDTAREAAARADREREAATAAAERVGYERDSTRLDAARRIEAESARSGAAVAELTRLRAETDRARADAARANSRLATEVAALREQLTTAQQQLHDHEVHRQSAERRADGLLDRIRVTEGERDAARTELEAARAQTARMDEQVSNLATALARLGAVRATDAITREAMAVALP